MSNPTPRRQLSQAWRQWTDIVRLFAEKHSASNQVSEADYLQRHQQVMALLRGLREQPNEADSLREDLYEQMNDLVRPWMTASALRDSDEWIRKDVLLQCLDCQREIDASGNPSETRVQFSEPSIGEKPKTAEPPVGKQSSRRFVVIMLLLASVFVIGIGCEYWSEIRQIAWVSSLTNSLGPSWRDMTRTDDVNFVLIRRVTVVIVILTAWAVCRPPRSY